MMTCHIVAVQTGILSVSDTHAKDYRQTLEQMLVHQSKAGRQTRPRVKRSSGTNEKKSELSIYDHFP